jgi:hypothetical protein
MNGKAEVEFYTSDEIGDYMLPSKDLPLTATSSATSLFSKKQWVAR